jgi:hypothetical protein
VTADLGQDGRKFAEEITHLLNTTVCDGVRMSCVSVSPSLVLIGYGLRATSIKLETFPVRDGRCWLRVGYQLRMDDEGQYLAVSSSVFGIYADAEATNCLCRFDYEREKSGYPPTHLQVYGTSEVLTAWPQGQASDHSEDCGEGCKLEHSGSPTSELERLHFPGGDRRYRPILEDVIEFLIVEQLATGRPGWRKAVNGGKKNFHRKQLAAAIRRDPETAREALAAVDAAAAPSQRPKKRQRGGK